VTSPRARHPWAWGWADRFPDDTQRDTLATMVGALLGVEALPRLALPTAADRKLPPSRLSVAALPAALQGFVRGDDDARAAHTYGRGYLDLVRGLRGDYAHAPDLVATPRDESEVEATLAWARAAGVAVFPYGGGTSVVAGFEAIARPEHHGTLTLSLRAMRRVLSVDPVDRVAHIEAGATGPELEAGLGEYTLRHFPQSFEFSTLGGWIATRAGGHFATLYTHIDDRVQAVRVLSPAGVWQTARVPASGAGPDPCRWILGSEGTLGVITSAWVRVLPRPRWRLSASVRFDAMAEAVEAARAIAQAGLHPANCRVLDPLEALLHRVSAADGGAVLLLGFESADHDPTAAMDRALRLATTAGGTCPGGVLRRFDAEGVREAASAQWREAFFEAPYLQSALVSLGVLVDTFETAVPWSRFEALHADVVGSVTEALQRVCGGGRVSCRFTHVYPDGPAPYYTFLGPATVGQELDQWAAVKSAASEALARHGATITHHHAVGRTHRPWYDRERPDLFAAALAATRKVVDPTGMLNPGVLTD
jgi:alkyldihydroxyacetonephosphate synthase